MLTEQELWCKSIAKERAKTSTALKPAKRKITLLLGLSHKQLEQADQQIKPVKLASYFVAERYE